MKWACFFLVFLSMESSVLFAGVCSSTQAAVGEADQKTIDLLLQAQTEFPAKFSKFESDLKTWGGTFGIVFGEHLPLPLVGANGQLLFYALRKGMRTVVHPPIPQAPAHPLSTALIHPEFAGEFKKLEALEVGIFLDASLSGQGAYYDIATGMIHMPADATWATFKHEAQHALFHKFLATKPNKNFAGLKVRVNKPKAGKVARQLRFAYWREQGLEIDAMLKGIRAGLSERGVDELMAGAAGIRAFTEESLGEIFLEPPRETSLRGAVLYRNTYVDHDLLPIPEPERTEAQAALLAETRKEVPPTVEEKETYTADWNNKAKKIALRALGLTALAGGAYEALMPGATMSIVSACSAAGGKLGWEAVSVRPVCYCENLMIEYPIKLGKDQTCRLLEQKFQQLQSALNENDRLKIRTLVFELYQTALPGSSTFEVRVAEKLAKSSSAFLRRYAYDLNRSSALGGDEWQQMRVDLHMDLQQGKGVLPVHHFHPPTFREQLRKDEPAALAYLEAYFNSHPGPVPPEMIDEIFTHSTPKTKLLALNHLRYFGRDGTEAARRALLDSNPIVRREATYFLLDVSSSYSQRGLKAIAEKDSDPDVQEMINYQQPNRGGSW